MSSKYIPTIRGVFEVDSLGLILPHEHLFTDLCRPSAGAAVVPQGDDKMEANWMCCCRPQRGCHPCCDHREGRLRESYEK